jgi:VWFA-related protein
MNKSFDSRLLRWCVTLLGLISQTGSGQSPSTARDYPSAAPTIHAQVQLVNIDVAVRDKNGQPIHALRREDFVLTEDNQTQAVRYFGEKSAQTNAQSGPTLPPLPAGTFSDYSPASSNGPLNVLLLDSLNTSMADQAYVRDQLRQYVKKIRPGTKIAIFGLSRKLVMLQGFNSDPEVLKDVVEHKLISRSSSLLEDPVGAGTTPESSSDIAASSLSSLEGASNLPIASVVSNMQQFEADQKAAATQFRIQYTLDALNILGHYLSAFPERKNLIWFSGSFPISLIPDPSSGRIDSQFNAKEFEETSSLLSKAQVAVYPVDARGLTTDSTYSAAATKSDPFGKNSAAFVRSQFNEHATMSQIAEDTGGQAFYNTNDLATAVQSAIDSGSNYYTLAYTPSSSKIGYRSIHVALAGKLASVGYSLEYRHEYFVDSHKNSAIPSTPPSQDANDNRSADYARLAMAHGAPTPQDILFKVRVLPTTALLEQELAQNNTQPQGRSLKPPFRRYAIDLVAVPEDFRLALHDSGNRTGSLEFSVWLYDNDGNLLNGTGKAIDLNLTPERYKQFLTGVNGHFEISVPAKAGGLFLRIGVRDISSNRIGAIEIPISSVRKLSPLSTSDPNR